MGIVRHPGRHTHGSAAKPCRWLLYTVLGVLILETIVLSLVGQEATRSLNWSLAYEHRMPIVTKGFTISPTELRAGCAGYSHIYTEYTTRRAAGWRAELKEESPCAGHK
jgi:hypothetical protein